MTERRRLFRNEAFARRGRSEPIDGLLRITAPHEWLFLAMLACALVGVLLWAVFGTVERGLSARCSLASSPAGELGAVAQLPAEDARRVAAGMSARVSLLGADGSLDGEVAQADLTVADSGDRLPLIRVSLPDAPPEAWRDGGACGLRIVTDREAPIRLIAAAPLGLE